MSDMAKKARAAMAAKAKSLTAGEPSTKVDSSDWTPPPMELAGVKTGLRPISRRQFKKGGKVLGENAKHNMGRKPRKSGGSAMSSVNDKINRNVKDANEERSGLKHVGGMKTGGRTKKNGGGGTDYSVTGHNTVTSDSKKPRSVPKDTGRAPQPTDLYDAEDLPKADSETRGYTKGGRTKKMLGGPMMGGAMMAPMTTPMSGGAAMPMGGGATGGGPDPRLGMVSKNALNFGVGAQGSPYKKGGKVEHDDEAADKALIKKMVKPSARAGHKQGGGVFSGPSYPGKVPGAVGGRTAHAAGGKAGKGKTNINIMVGAHKPEGGPGMPMAPGMNPMAGPIKPPGLGGPAGGAPLPPGPPGMPPMPPGGAPAGAPPMPPGMLPPGGPMPRKAGGRAYSSYKDMDAGSGGGEGRLKKTEIAKKKTGIQRA